MFPDMTHNNLFGAMCVGSHCIVSDDNDSVISSGRRRGMKRLSRQMSSLESPISGINTFKYY